MNRSLLTLGIVLSFGSVGCAGFGLQSSSALAGQYHADRGVDALWSQQDELPRGAETPLYAEQELGQLWGIQGESPATIVELGANEARGGDLWNPASVARSWEPSGFETTVSQRAGRGTGRLWY